jgi:hypothetical protein
VSDTDSVNPFAFDRPLGSAKELIDREEQVAGLREALARGVDAMVEGPQRHGKTSLVNAALAEFTNRELGIALRVDCDGVLTASDLVRRIQRAYAGAWTHGSAEERLIEQLESSSFRFTSNEVTPVERVEGLLDVAVEAARSVGGRALVALDEVQDVLAVEEIVDALARARGRGGEAVTYVFVGHELCSAEHGPWSGQPAAFVVDRISPERFADEVRRRFADTGREAGEAAEVIATMGAGHPQRSSLLAAQLWQLTPSGSRATVATARSAIDNALLRCVPELEVRWSALHSNERRVAVAIATGIAPQGTRAQRATGLAGFGAAQRALQGVKTSGVARTDGDQATLTDPLFAEWLRRRNGQVPAEPDWQALRRRNEMQRRGITRGM